jgi:hypothetical protein
MSGDPQLADRALAHYLWPPQWVGAPPLIADVGTSDVVKVGGPEDRIVDRDLPRGIRACVFRDGMIALALGDSDPTYTGDFLAWQQTLVRLMNAHLACLHASCPPPGVMLSSVVTIWSTLQVELETGAFRGASTGNSGGFATDLYDLRRTAPTKPFDQRILRGPLIAVKPEWVEASFDLLSSLLDKRETGSPLLESPLIFRAELLQRAKVASLDNDQTGALTNAWIACEGMLGDLLRTFLDSIADRNVEGGTGAARKFMNSKRREFFGRGEWTIRHTVELLSIVDVLPFHLYHEALDGAKARNNWVHYETVPPSDAALKAIRLAGELFGLLEGIDLRVLGKPGGSRHAP